jgi:hypothetical protein
MIKDFTGSVGSKWERDCITKAVKCWIYQSASTNPKWTPSSSAISVLSVI